MATAKKGAAKKAAPRKAAKKAAPRKAAKKAAPKKAAKKQQPRKAAAENKRITSRVIRVPGNRDSFFLTISKGWRCI